MKTMKTRMLMLFGLLLMIVCLGLGITAYNTSSSALIQNIKNTIPDFAIEAAKTIEMHISAQTNSLEALALNPSILHFNDSNTHLSEAKLIMQNELQRAGHLRMAVVNDKGQAFYSNGDSANLKDQNYFKAAMSGNKLASEPVSYENNKTLVMVYAVPIIKDTKVIGVLIAERDGYELSELTAKIKYGNSGNTFIINKTAKTIAHTDKNFLSDLSSTDSPDVVSGATSNEPASDALSAASANESGESLLQNQSLPQDQNYLKVTQQMIQGENGFGEYQYKGNDKYIGFAPIHNTDWSLGIEVNKVTVLSGLNTLKVQFIIMALIFLLISFIITYFIAMNIDRPIKYLTQECYHMSNGDFSRVLIDKYKKRKDEIGLLATAFQMIGDNLKKLLKDNINISTQVFSSSQSLNDMNHQSLYSIKVISDSVEKISSVVALQAEDTQIGVAKTTEVGELIEQEQTQMLQLVESADKVDQMKNEGFDILKELIQKTKLTNHYISQIYDVIMMTNKSIHKIFESSNHIENIARQTNLLALNAAIEASRAGEAGKGFSIVAEEIRQLAEGTTQFAKEIMSLIAELNQKSEGSVTIMEEVSDMVSSQTESVKMTQLKFEGISFAIEDTKDSIKTLSESIEKMRHKKDELIEIIDHLSSISQNSAEGTQEVMASVEEQTAYTEHIAQLSENLSQLSLQMNECIKHFKSE